MRLLRGMCRGRRQEDSGLWRMGPFFFKRAEERSLKRIVQQSSLKDREVSQKQRGEFISGRKSGLNIKVYKKLGWQQTMSIKFSTKAVICYFDNSFSKSLGTEAILHWVEKGTGDNSVNTVSMDKYFKKFDCKGASTPIVFKALKNSIFMGRNNWQLVVA